MTRDGPLHTRPEGGPKPTAYALRGEVTLPGPRSEGEIRAGVEAFLDELARSLRERGCRLIGHIKGVLEPEGKGRLFFSVTSFEQKGRFKGALTGAAGALALSLNVIVYGVEAGEIEGLVLAGLRRHLGDLATGIRDQGSGVRDQGPGDQAAPQRTTAEAVGRAESEKLKANFGHGPVLGRRKGKGERAKGRSKY